MIPDVTLNNPAVVAIEMRVAVVVVRLVDELDEFVVLMVKLLAAVTVGSERFVATVVLPVRAIVDGVVVLLLTIDVLP